MSQVKEEHISEIFIKGTTDDNLLTKTNNMQTTNEAFTSKNEMIKNRRLDPSVYSLNEWNDTGNVVMDLVLNLSNWPVLYQKGLPEISVLDLFEKLGITELHGNTLLQIFKLRDFKGNWSEDIKRYRLIFTRKYEGYDPAWNVKLSYKYDQISAHGHEFFIEFFEKTKHWFDLK